MPYEITWEPHGAYRKTSGFVSNDEMRKSFRVLHEDDRYNSLLYVLHDSTEVTGHEFRKEDVTLLLANHLGASGRNPNMHDLVVSADKKLIDTLQSSVVVKLMPTPVEYFQTITEARARIAEIIAQSNNS